jgi:hypothetical protein
MRVYITYDRYERDEWYNIYHLSTDREESIKHCKEVDLPDFISYGPDDCHSFQIQEVEMTPEEYEQFKSWVDDDSQSLENYGDKSSDLFKKMYEYFDRTGDPKFRSEIILSTDGCTDNVDIVHYYGKQKGLNTKDDDIYYDLEEELFNDEELYNKILKDYINDTY